MTRPALATIQASFLALSSLRAEAPLGAHEIEAAEPHFVINSSVNNFGKGRVYATGQEILELSLKQKHAAAKVYDGIRKSTDDIAKIVKNTGISESRIARVKDHVFQRSHQLDDGFRRFHPNPRIADAWKRLEAGRHTADDLAFLKHELFESRFEGIFKTNYRLAHGAVERAAQRQAARAAGLEGWRDVGRIAQGSAVEGTSAARAADRIASTGRVGSRPQIRENEITTFQDSRARSRIGDQLEGHELLQHAFLKNRGLATTRFSTEASRMNPVIALPRPKHINVNKSQAALDVASRRALEHIAENARILREAGLPQSYVQDLLLRAIEHARKLGLIGWIKG